MKKFYILFILLATIGLSGLVNAQVPTNGLVGYWPFNGNANDESGNGYNGTVTGATLTPDRFGNTNKAYYFNGVTDYILANVNSNVTNVSISAWFYAETHATTFPTFYYLMNSTNTIYYYSQLTYHQGNTGSILNLVHTSTGNYPNVTTNVPSLNSWHHVVSVFDGSWNVSKLYLDGALINQVTTTGTLTTFTKFFMGSHDLTCLCEWFKGSLDDIRIYNRALSSTEVTALYNENPCTAIQPHANDISLCGGGTTTLTATGGTNYIWYTVPTGGTQISSGATYTTPFLTSTTTYYVANFDGTCESPRDTVVVTFVPLPNVTITGLANAYCKNSAPITLTANPTGGAFSGTGVSSNLFTPGLATIGANIISYAYTDPVTTCSKTTTQSVTVNAIPTVSFTGLNATYTPSDPPVSLTGTPTNGTFSGVGIIGNKFYPSVSGSGNANVVYIFTDANGCANAICQSTDVTTFVEAVHNGNGTITIQPNPSNGNFDIALNIQQKQDVQVKVFNNVGACVYSTTYKNVNGSYTAKLNLSSEAAGVYLVKINGVNYSTEQNIIISK